MLFSVVYMLFSVVYMLLHIKYILVHIEPDINTKVAVSKCLDEGLLVPTKKHAVLTKRREILIAGRKEFEVTLRKIP